jgi:peptidoglycan-associated lipoprotein
MRADAARIGALTVGLGLAAVLLTGCPKTPVVMPAAGARNAPASGQTTPAPPPAGRSAPAPAASFASTSALGDVHFDVDRAAIRSADQAVLDANAGWLRFNAEARLLLEGYAEERGSSAHNRALAERRAATVRGALVARGIEASRISIRSYGEERPVCADQTDPCWAKNRRVRFLVSR